MPKYNISDVNGEWLGVSHGENEEEALENAKKQGMPTATQAKERE